MYGQNPPVQESIIDADLLREYIAFARATVFPRLTNEASNELIEAYVKMRKLGWFLKWLLSDYWIRKLGWVLNDDY